MYLTADERAILLVALHELRVTQTLLGNLPTRDVPRVAKVPPAVIDALVVRLGGDPDAPMFGSDAVHP